MLCLVSIPIIAVDVPEEWLIEVKTHIEDLQAQVDLLTVELNETEKMLDIYRQREKAQQGWYVGGNVTYPLGANAIGMYKFKRWGWYATGGYNNGFNIGTGIMVKIGGD